MRSTAMTLTLLPSFARLRSKNSIVSLAASVRIVDFDKKCAQGLDTTLMTLVKSILIIARKCDLSRMP